MTANGPDRGEDDLAVARRCLAGDEAAWTRVVERHRPAMIELAQRIVPEAAALDLVDAVIADVWQRRKLERYEGRSALSTWLGAVTINAALNARRSFDKHALTVSVGGDQPDVPATPSIDADHAPLAGILNDAIAALPAESKLLVRMYYEQGLTLDQAAVVLKRSKSTLSRMLLQARGEIRREADRLARERFRTTLDALRAGADLGRLDVDIRTACAPVRDSRDPRVSNS